MKKADHLSVDFGIYTHHGIYLGDNQVIHFGRGLHDIQNAKVEIVSLEEFSHGDPTKIVNSEIAFSPEQVIERAKSRLNETNYDLFDNNCEHFVHWCRSGKPRSEQIETTSTVAKQAAAAMAKPVISGLIAKRLVKASTAKAAARIAVRSSGAALAGDLAQATAEIVAARKGLDKKATEDVGRATGATASAVVGFAAGGPVGSAASLGIWFIGQRFAEHTLDKAKTVIRDAVQDTSE